jgi:hypothetical protein
MRKSNKEQHEKTIISLPNKSLGKLIVVFDLFLVDDSDEELI